MLASHPHIEIKRGVQERRSEGHTKQGVEGIVHELGRHGGALRGIEDQRGLVVHSHSEL